MKNKHKRKSKLKYCWFLPPLGLASILIPVCLTSCANISQYILPITTGSIANGPYTNVYSGSSDKDFFDEKYSDYLPNNFITYINRSASNSVTGYGYMDPQNIKKSQTGSGNPTNGQFDGCGWGYYGFNDKKMQYINDGDKNSTIRSFQNLNQTIATSAISSVSASLSSLFNTMVKFVAQTGIVNSDKYRGTWIDKLLNSTGTSLGDDWHRDPNDSSKNEKFFEFLFSLENLLSTGQIPYRFDVSSQDFNFKNTMFIDKDDCLGAGDGESALSSGKKNYNAYSNKQFDPTTQQVGNTPIDTWVQAYASYADCGNKNDQGNPYHYLSNFAYSIPSVISLNDSSPNTQFTFYNPLKNHGFIPNEYLNVDMNKVQKAINESSAWKSIDNLIGKKHSQIKDLTQTYGINVNNFNSALPSATVSSANYEPALQQIIQNLHNDKSTDFISLNSYTVVSYKLPTDDHNNDFYSGVTDFNKDKDGNNSFNVHIPLFYGVQENLYPIMLLFNKDGQFDETLLKNQTKAIFLDPKTGKARNGHDGDNDKLKYLDVNKLNDKFAQFVAFLTTMVKSNTDPNNYNVKYKSKYFNGGKTGNIDIPYYMNVFNKLLGNENSDKWLEEIK